MDLAEALAGRAGLAGVHWVLRGRPMRRVLRRALGAALSAPGLLGPCRLRRAKFKPGRRLTAWYDVRVRGRDGEADSVRPIAVTWTPREGTAWREAAPEPTGMEAAAVRAGLAAPFDRLLVEVPEWGMRIYISPLDEQFGQLVRVSDPRHVGDMLAAVRATSAGGPGGPAAPLALPAITSVRYRPGERHVLRYDAVGSTRTAERTGTRATVFAKLHADEQGARSFLVAVGVADWLAACRTGVTAVRPLAYVAADGLVLYPLVAGRPLSRHLRRPRPGSAKHLWAAGAALRALHCAPAALASELERHDFAGEVTAIARTSEHIRALLPAAGATIEEILERAQTVHARLPPEPPTFAHGDFKADHLLVAPGGLRLIDFDSCCLADPALDVGKFLADLQWWYTAYGQPGVEQAQERFLAGYVAGDRAGDGRGAPGARLVRARLYEAVLLVKLAAHRVRLFDRDWAPRTEQLIGRARAGLHALQGLAAHPAA